MAGASAVGLPATPHLSLSLDVNLVPLIVLVVLTSLLDTLSATISLEKLEDGDWRRADLPAAERAVVGTGLANMVGGLTSAVPTCVSRSGIGFTASTGATARVIGFLAGALIFAAAFFPKLFLFLTLVPPSVTGGLLLFTAT